MGGVTLNGAPGWLDLPHDRRFGDMPVSGALLVAPGEGRYIAVLARSPSLLQVFFEHFFQYATAVGVLMLLLLAASQLLIRFLLGHLNTLEDVMLHVERSGDLAACVPLDNRDETDQAATAINEMAATVHHISQHAGDTRDQSQNAGRLASDGQRVVTQVEQAISGMSQGVKQTAEKIERLASDSQRSAV